MNTVQVAVLPGGAAPPAISGPTSVPRQERIGVQMAAFAALGLYGILRWDTLLSGGAFGRLIGLLALSATLAVGLMNHLPGRPGVGVPMAAAAFAIELARQSRVVLPPGV